MLRRLVFLITLVLLVIAAGSARGGLVARYTFDDGTASDSAYYYTNADGTFYGDAHVVDDPCRGFVLELDGNDDFVKVLNSEVANFSTESFTFTFWEKCSVHGVWYYFWRGTNVDDELIGVNSYHDDSAEVRYTLYNYEQCQQEVCKVRTNVSDVNFVTGQWAHIACVRDADAGELRFYANGKLEAPISSEYNPEGDNPSPDTVGDISNSGNLHIGANDRGDPDPEPDSFFPGHIDDFRVYNHALSAEDINKLATGWQDPNLASDPKPRHGNLNVCPNVELSWVPGVNADSHDVYLGTDYLTVQDATTSDTDVFRVNQGPNTYDAGALETLEPGERYFWRIDERSNTHSESPWKGQVWIFRINQGKAHSPEPSNGETMVPIEQELIWTVGCYADSHDVYFGTNFNDVNEATTCDTRDVFQCNQPLGDTDYPPGGLEYFTDYYWRIDEINEPNVYKGDVWHFRSESSIFDPNLRAWYKLDESEGAVAYDSSGREYNAYVYGDGVWEPNNGYDGGCFHFDDDTHISLPTPVHSTINKGVTITVWLNSDVSDSHNNVICAVGDDDFQLRAAVPDETADIGWRAGDDVNDVLNWSGGNPSAWVGAWNHFAFIKDENKDKIQVYVNGSMVADKTNVSTGTLAEIQGDWFKIGAEVGQGSDLEGRLDEFRLYDRALLPLEIAEIFFGGNLELAWGPEPYNGQVDVPRDVNMIWNPGQFAVRHDVYFGTNFNDVNNATTSDADIYKGQQDANLYDPNELLELGQSYYWRIDEVNDYDPNVWEGNIWSFTVANFLTIEDFEDYSDDQQLTSSWSDGGWPSQGGNGSCATIQLGTRETSEPVYVGDQSMSFGYANGDAGSPYGVYYSETERVFDPNLDLTQLGMKMVTFFFRGSSDPLYWDGPTSQMYIGLKDTGDTYQEVKYGEAAGEDINDIRLTEWQEWNIPLSEFSNVEVEHVASIFIGFGDRTNTTTPEGRGKVFIDEIRRYPSKCVPAYGPVADFSGNCIVDYADIAIMAEQWLRTDINFPDIGITVQEPASPNLVGWWKLDGNADDSSGKGNHGTAQGQYLWVTGYDEVNQGIEFAQGRILVPDDASLSPSSTVSVAAWVEYTDDPGDSSRVVVKGRNDMECYAIEMGSERNCGSYVGDVNGTRYFADSNEGDVPPGEWLHLACTYDGTQVTLYINGLVEDTEPAEGIQLSQDANGLAIGNRSDANDRPYHGKVDDVRVYDYGLSQAQVAWLASDGEAYVPLRTQVNLYDAEPKGEKAANLRDLAALINDWMKEILWPAE